MAEHTGKWIAGAIVVGFAILTGGIVDLNEARQTVKDKTQERVNNTGIPDEPQTIIGYKVVQSEERQRIREEEQAKHQVTVAEIKETLAADRAKLVEMQAKHDALAKQYDILKEAKRPEPAKPQCQPVFTRGDIVRHRGMPEQHYVVVSMDLADCSAFIRHPSLEGMSTYTDLLEKEPD